ncbi:uncharacterized protein [Phyllobates terribilis]|uniref:uncharacterized protein n=1 Tax=Phyllobates terribilis TaxID=111132 RepID=UPI003CCB3FAC
MGLARLLTWKHLPVTYRAYQSAYLEAPACYLPCLPVCLPGSPVSLPAVLICCTGQFLPSDPWESPALIQEIPGMFPRSQTRGASMPIPHVGGGRERLMELVRSSVASSTWRSYDGVKHTVRILGHSYIFWASQRAERRPGGRGLGFHGINVFLRGIRGLTWPQVLPEVVRIAQTASSPLILVLHAGGNDLCSFHLAELLTIMRSDVDKFHRLFPELTLIWSEVMSRVAWQGARDVAAVERSVRTLNARLSRFIRFKAGVVMRHHQLEGDNSSLMLPDGVHLTEIGLDIFLSGLQDSIEQAFYQMGGGRSAV